MKNRFCWIIVSIITISFLFNFTGCSEPEVPHEHKYADWWEYDETYHWKPAICEHKSEFSEKAEHDFGDWTITKQPTTTEEGTKIRSCSVCVYVEECSINPEDPDDPNDPDNPDDPDDPTPGTEYDVTNLVVAEKTIDSVTISFQDPQNEEIWVNGFYFTVNGVKPEQVTTYDELDYDYRTDTYSYTFTDKNWRSENGTSVTIKVTTDYITYDSEYNEIQKESEGVSVTETTEPFDGTLPAYTGYNSNRNLETIKVGDTYDEKKYLSYDFDLATWEFKSSDEAIATVDENGIVTGVKSGSAKIMFKNTDGIWFYREYTITDVLAKGMAINTIFSKVGETLDADDIVFTSAEKDFAVSDKNVTWSADDSTMVTIDGGKLTFEKAGNAKVTATYTSNPNITATAEVVVFEETVKLKEDLTVVKDDDDTIRYYIDEESGLAFSANELFKDVNGEISSFYSYNIYNKKFDENFIYKDTNYSIESIPVIENENTISIYYVVKTAGVDMTFGKGSLMIEIPYEAEEEEDSYSWQLDDRTKEWVYFVKADFGEKEDYLTWWKFNQFKVEENETKTFKVTYQIKERSGKLDATIY